MPTIYEAKMDGSNAIRYFHISLVRFYLDLSFKYSSEAVDEQKEGVLLPSSVIGIVFSAMSIESFINEVSEDVIPKEELVNFIRLRKTYKKSPDESSVTSKLRIMFKAKFDYDLPEGIKQKIEEVISLRNNLAHYKLTDLAGKYIMPPTTTMPVESGGFMTTLDFTLQPERIEHPFVQSVTGLAAAKSFNCALEVINMWGRMQGVDDSVPGLEPIA